MAVRVHVFGALGITEADLRMALNQIGEPGEAPTPFRLGSSGPWAWANASIWQVGGQEIDQVLSTLKVPALRVTSCDGVLWMLTLTNGEGELFRGVHHFTFVGSEPCEPDHPESEQDDEDEEELDEDSAAEVAKFEEMMQQFNEAAEQMQEAAKIPHSGEVLYKGRTGRFYRASFSNLEHVSADQLKRIDEAIEELGFQFVVDSVGDVDQQQEISRLYVNEQAIGLHGRRKEDNQFGFAPASHGAVLVDFSRGTTEWHTHFEDGSVLVTTSVYAVQSKPEQDIYIRCYEDVPLDVLWAKHCDGIERFRDHRQTIPVNHLRFNKPKQLLKQMDKLFTRFLQTG